LIEGIQVQQRDGNPQKKKSPQENKQHICRMASKVLKKNPQKKNPPNPQKKKSSKENKQHICRMASKVQHAPAILRKTNSQKKQKKTKKCRVAFKFSKALAILKRFLSQLARLRQSPAANSPLFAEQVVMRACGPDSKSYSSAYNIIYHAPARERRKR